MGQRSGQQLQPHPAGVADVALFVVAPDGRLLDTNDAAERLLAADAEGRLAVTFGDPALLARAAAGLPLNMILDLPTAAEPAGQVSLSVVPDGPDNLLAVATRLTVPRPSATPERWIDLFPVMLGSLDRQTRWQITNRALRTTLGLDEVELRQRRLIEQLHEADRPLVERGLAAAADSPWQAEVRLRRPAGWLTVALALTARREPDGRLTGYRAALFDLTELKSSEFEIESYTHELELLFLKLEQRTQELEEANEEIRRARLQTIEAEELARLEQMKTAFLDVAAHELRTPVTLISGCLEYLQEDLDGAMTELLLRGARKSAARLTRIVENALTLLTRGAPQFDGQYERTSLLKVVRDAATDVQPFLELRRQTLITELPGTLPKIVMDVSMIRDVAVHLLMNAIKFTPDEGSLRLTAGADDDGVWFAVTDGGQGISEFDLPHIFERFFCSLDTRTHSSGDYEYNTRGPGFGLAIVRKFVDLHKGRVDVRNEPDGGATFVVHLPDNPNAVD